MNMWRKLINILFYLLIALLIFGCSEEKAGIYKPKAVGETPVITVLSPENKGVAGVTEITIVGEKFSEFDLHCFRR